MELSGAPSRDCPLVKLKLRLVLNVNTRLTPNDYCRVLGLPDALENPLTRESESLA